MDCKNYMYVLYGIDIRYRENGIKIKNKYIFLIILKFINKVNSYFKNNK